MVCGKNRFILKSMNIRIEGNTVVISLSFWERVWAFHRSFRIPRSHVTGMSQALPPSTWKEIRIPGTFLPGIIKAGTYLTPRGKEFWYVTRRNPQPLVLELRDEKYKRIVLTLPAGTAAPAL